MANQLEIGELLFFSLVLYESVSEGSYLENGKLNHKAMSVKDKGQGTLPLRITESVLLTNGTKQNIRRETVRQDTVLQDVSRVFAGPSHLFDLNAEFDQPTLSRHGATT